VLRETDPDDRRAFIVRLTETGHATFARFAEENERFVLALFKDMDERSIDALMRDLQKLKTSVRRAAGAG